MKDKIKNKIHKARLHVLTNERTQMILYAIAIIFVIAIVSVLVISTINQQRAFLKYQVKSCYDKSEISSNESPVIKYATIGGNVVVSYEFEQKCYRKLDIEHTKGQDSINLYIN